MGLLGPSGSSEQRSSREIPAQGKSVNESTRMDPRNKYAANAADYDHLAPIHDTFTTQTALNPDRYPEQYKQLLAYPKGFPMVVPYYHRQDPAIDHRSMVVDISVDEDAIHGDLTKINNLEMKLEESLQFTVQEEDNSTQLTGSAIMYPGLEPFVGDIFFMEVDNRQQLVFMVNVVEPTTYRQERYYKVKFSSFTQLTASLLERIEAAVTSTCYFERRKYFGESQLTFLSFQSWKNLKELEKYRKSIAQDLVNFFFDADAESFFRSDGIYDPYVTEFLRSKLTVKDNGVHPLQLLVPLENFHRSIWYKFILAENCENLEDVWQFCNIKYKDPKIFVSSFNSLIDRNYVELAPSGGIMYPDIQGAGTGMITGSGASGAAMDCGCVSHDPRYPRLIHDTCEHHGHFPDRWEGYDQFYHHYKNCPVCNPCENAGATNASGAQQYQLFTPDFYNGFVDGGTSKLERILYGYLHDRTVDVEQVLELVRPYRKLGTSVLAFYSLTIYLELVDAAIVAIH